MSKLEELRKIISEMFQKATDEETIRKSAVVAQKLDEAEEESKQSSEKYDKLLNDYKDVVLHSSFKSDSAVDLGDSPKKTSLSMDDFLEGWKSKKSK